MKKRFFKFLLVMILVFVFAMPMMGCKGNSIECVCDEGCNGACNFELTIWVEETTVAWGEGFYLNAELKNLSGEDLRIHYYFIFLRVSPDPQHRNPSIPIRSRSFKDGEAIQLTFADAFPRGNYQLQYRTSFYLDWRQRDSAYNDERRVIIYSNIIEISVI